MIMTHILWGYVWDGLWLRHCGFATLHLTALRTRFFAYRALGAIAMALPPASQDQVGDVEMGWHTWPCQGGENIWYINGPVYQL